MITTTTTANTNIVNLQGAQTTANGSIAAAFDKANQVGGAANTINSNVSAATSNIANLSGALSTANTNITSAFLKANQVGGAVTTANTNITSGCPNTRSRQSYLIFNITNPS